MSTIESIKAREILDSRGNPTLEVEEDIPRCSSCGMCCRGERHYGLILLPGDYERWVQKRREDILCYIESSINGIYLALIWKSLETGEHLDYCPFLEKAGQDKYICTIQDTKPKICKEFWCAWAYSIGEKGVAYKTFNGWTAGAKQRGSQWFHLKVWSAAMVR